MATKQLSSDFMQQIAYEQAWKKLSGYFSWTDSLLEEYHNKVDWQKVSENQRIQWTIPIVQKFKNRIDWKLFSRYANEKFLTEDSLEAFKDKWDWNELSGNLGLDLTEELLDKFIDKWDWKGIINPYFYYGLFDINPIGFYEKYKEHLPASLLQDSGLWKEIVKAYKKNLRAKILA